MCISLIPPTAYTRKNSVTQVSSFTSLPFPPSFEKPGKRGCMPTGSWHLLKVNRGQKVWLVIAASHFDVSWLLLLDFKHRYVVLVIALTSLCLLFPLSALWLVAVSLFHSVTYVIIIFFAYQPSWPGNDIHNTQHGSHGAEYNIRWVKGFHPLEYSTNLEWGK